MRQLKVDQLARERVQQVYPLIQLAKPRLSLDDWRVQALAHIDAKNRANRGFLGVEDERGVVLGVLQYEVDEDGEEGRVLRIRNFVALDLFEKLRDHVAEELIRAMDRLAADHGCVAIHTRLPQSQPPRRNVGLDRILEAHGHQRSRRTFYKTTDLTRGA